MACFSVLVDTCEFLSVNLTDKCSLWFPVTEVNYWVSDTFFLLSGVSQKPFCYKDRKSVV